VGRQRQDGSSDGGGYRVDDSDRTFGYARFGYGWVGYREGDLGCASFCLCLSGAVFLR
jgi:hypothetical protein